MELLRLIADSIANGKTISDSCKEANITKSMYLSWRKEFGVTVDKQAQRIRKLERENAQLRRLVSDLCLQKLALRDMIASGGP
jgi:transposase-like protein